MVILAHLKRQGGAKTHHTHDLSNHERISQRLQNLVLVHEANSKREIIGTVMAQKIGL
jgi:hypothetical protein